MPRIRLLTILTLLIAFSCSKPDLETPAPPDPPPPKPVAKVPKLITDSVRDITVFSATFGGRIIDTGGAKVTEQGIVVGLDTGATVTNNFNKFKIITDSSGYFRININEIPGNTTFYIKAYAINAVGEGYGNEIRYDAPGGITAPYDAPTILTSQEEVDAYGAKRYTTLINGLEITGTTVTDLSPLKSIAIIGGGLRIHHTSLENLKGLDSIEIIGHNFFNSTAIENNPLLKDLTGLNRVKLIRGPVQLAWNNSLINLQGLNNVKLMHGSALGIYHCPNIQNLDGIDNLVILDGGLTLNDNPSLTNINALRNLEELTWDVRVLENPLLTNLDGLEKIKKIRYLQLTRNASFTSLHGLRNLEILEGINLENMDVLGDFSPLQKLKTIDYLEISYCNSVRSMEGFSNLESINKYLNIQFNPNLRDFTGLEKLKTAGRISIGYNNSLVNLQGLNGLESITGPAYALGISQNPSLTSLSGLENLSTSNGIYMENNSPQLNFCAIKKFASNYNGNDFVIFSNWVPVTQQEIVANCP